MNIFRKVSAWWENALLHWLKPWVENVLGFTIYNHLQELKRVLKTVEVVNLFAIELVVAVLVSLYFQTLPLI